MQQEPTLYIGRQPWYIGRFWIDGKTGEIREDTDTKKDQQRRLEKTINFARDFGFIPTPIHSE